MSEPIIDVHRRIRLSERGVVEVKIDEATDAVFLAAEQIDETKPQASASMGADDGTVDRDGKGGRRRLKLQRDRRAEGEASTGSDETASNGEVRDGSMIRLLCVRRPFGAKPCRADDANPFVIPPRTLAIPAEPCAKAVPAQLASNRVKRQYLTQTIS